MSVQVAEAGFGTENDGYLEYGGAEDTSLSVLGEHTCSQERIHKSRIQHLEWRTFQYPLQSAAPFQDIDPEYRSTASY